MFLLGGYFPSFCEISRLSRFCSKWTLICL
jgi:hypothetical protein